MDQLIRRSAADQAAVQVVGAGGKQQERLLALDAGTSLAAPLVSHAALTVWGRYPGLSGNAVRALLLASVVPVENVLNDPATALSRAAHRRLTGYGRVSVERAAASFDHRAVLVAESVIALDGVHVYRVPIPKVFFATGRPSVLALALAYDPPVRQTRLDYLASRMEAFLYHGPSTETVASAYVAEVAAADGPPVDSALGPTSISDSRLKLDPSTADQSRGAHQYGSTSRQQRWDQSKGDEFVIAVRNINKWDTRGAEQTYALVLTLERPGEPSLYADLRAQLEAVVEVEVEIEAET